MRTPSETDSLSTLTRAALDRGIIDAAQRDRLLELAHELAHEPEVPTPESAMPHTEARGGFDIITVAYALGALLVLFALGWFLVDRWSSLGSAGVLAVAALYAVAFGAAGATLLSRGFHTAGGLAIVLAVCMTPVWTWAVLRLTGLWPDPADMNDALSRFDPYIAARAIVIDLATIGVALAALRRVRFFALGAPIAVAFVALLIHLGMALGDPRLTWYVGPYYQLVIACATLAVAYAIDRRQPPREDYALWFYLAGVVMLFVGYVGVWSSIGAWRHALPLVAAALVTASLYLRRRVLVIAGGVAAFCYLGYLAFDVFRRVVALPVALAALGLLVIVAAVWVQRRFPALLARVSRDEGAGRKTLPTGPIAVLGPLAIVTTAMFFAASEARDRTADRDWLNRFYARRAHRETATQRQAQREPAAVRRATPDSSSLAPAPPRRPVR
jgi:hypothetical protein